MYLIRIPRCWTRVVEFVGKQYNMTSLTGTIAEIIETLIRVHGVRDTW